MNNIIKKLKKIVRNLIKGSDRYEQIFQNIRQRKPLNIMEIGVWSGERAKEMILEANKFNKLENIHYYGFDLFEEIDQETFKDEISKWPPTEKEVLDKLNNLGAQIHLYKGNTMETFPKYIDSLPKMDFVFIDGGHKIETVQNDWDFTEKLMDKNTVVIFDDYWPERGNFGGSKNIVDNIDTYSYNVEILKTIDNVENKDFGKFSIQLAKVTKK